jgi:hypothetical protein
MKRAGEAVLQGAVVEAPTTLGNLVDLGRYGLALGQRRLEGAVLGETTAGVRAGEREPFRFGLGERARSLGKGALASIGRPYREPTGGMRYLQRAVGGAVVGAPFGAAAGAPGMALEGALGATSEMAAQGAADYDLGEGGQAVAGALGGFGPAAAIPLARPVAKYVGQAIPGISGGLARHEAQRQMMQAIGPDPARLARAKELLSEEQGIRRMMGNPAPASGMPEGVGAASSAQVLGQRGPDYYPGVEMLSSSLGRESPSYQTRAGQGIAGNLEEIGRAGKQHFPADVAPERVRGRLEEEIAANQAEEAAAYREVDELGVRGSSEPLHRSLSEMERRSRGGLEEEIPKRQSGLIREHYTEESIDPQTGAKITKPKLALLEELHNFRKSVNADLERYTAKPEGNAYKIRNLMKMKEAIDQSLDETAAATDVGQAEVGKLRDAIALMRRYESVYSGHPAIDAFRRYHDEPLKALDTALRQPNAAEEIQNLRAALRGDREAEEGLKRLFVRRALLGERVEGDLSEVTDWVGRASTAKRFIAKHRKAAKEILGSQEAVRSFERFLDRAKKTTGGNVGTGRQAVSTQSGVAPLAALGIARRPASGALEAVAQRLSERYPKELSELLESALIEPAIMNKLLEDIPATRFEAWAKELEDTYLRKTGRQLRRLPGRAAGLRSEEEQIP